MNLLNAKYVIICRGAEADYPELCRYVEASGHYTKVLEHDYTSRLVRGAERWTLYRRTSAASILVGERPLAVFDGLDAVQEKLLSFRPDLSEASCAWNREWITCSPTIPAAMGQVK